MTNSRPAWSNRLWNGAKAVSALGHPLLTIAVFTFFVSFRFYDRRTALFSSLVILGVVVLPVTLWNYRRARRGAYSNFDVSVRTQRPSMYVLVIAALSAALALLWAANQPRALRLGVFFTLVIFAVSFALNFRIKPSLHAAMSFYLAVLLYVIEPAAGAVMLGASLLIAVSRLVLGRHTTAEIVVGTLIGLCAAAGFWFSL